MTEEQMSEALDAIHDEVPKLARRDDLTAEVEHGLNLILLLSEPQVRRARRERKGERRWAVTEPEDHFEITGATRCA